MPKTEDTFIIEGITDKRLFILSGGQQVWNFLPKTGAVVSIKVVVSQILPEVI